MKENNFEESCIGHIDSALFSNSNEFRVGKNRTIYKKKFIWYKQVFFLISFPIACRCIFVGGKNIVEHYISIVFSFENNSRQLIMKKI